MKKKNTSYSEKHQNIEVLIFSVLAVLVPILLGHGGVIAVIIINIFLIVAGVRLKSWRILPIILLPSVGGVLTTIIAGQPYTNLLILTPAIWVGNYLLVYSMQQKRNYWIRMALGSCLKSGFLFIVAYSLVFFKVLPQIFLITMGPLQLGTALGAGVIAFFYLMYIKRKN